MTVPRRSVKRRRNPSRAADLARRNVVPVAEFDLPVWVVIRAEDGTPALWKLETGELAATFVTSESVAAEFRDLHAEGSEVVTFHRSVPCIEYLETCMTKWCASGVVYDPRTEYVCMSIAIPTFIS